ncbi:zinc-dependent peptidase [Catalinimonas niigatensis]|uniref:zinc-dependent peptidase n=1 Tax=Catalinimonas niigatensis TaxID=1397264 RepID=UPI002665C35B|nr:zinc-dependent peptidase [Catalinimonas niigatensis]WPP48586.1 zinc-dependent peptidase [Catalinimonas niigatensis]
MNEQQPEALDTNALLTGMIIALILVGAYLLYQYWRHRKAALSSVPEEEVHQILHQHFAYYKALNAQEKSKFIKRVQLFIGQKVFIPRMFKVVTHEMKVLIAASAVQLTFGLPEISLQHFRRIIIYPDYYYSTVTKRMHKGEVNPKAQAVVLSWKSFLQGYQITDDSYNLGLHEMAHALELENMIENNEYEFLHKETWQQFQQEASRIRTLIKKGEPHFFRAYAATNEKEFFAIAVENFFERPMAFQHELPHLYGILVSLLNQNPLEKRTF